MKVAVRLFARYREAAGRERLEVDVPDGGTVESAWAALVARHPELEAYRPYTLFAIGTDYVAADAPLRPGEELCCFPPVSGGGDGFYRITTDPLSEAELTGAVASPEAGGIAVFSGVVRNETGARAVKYLEYEAHAPMAEAKMREIGAAVYLRWPSVKRVAMAH
ncbi:MAG: molybdenum cofactor biosynthesis protein MoaE, partial [Nitrospinota bacterium]